MRGSRTTAHRFTDPRALALPLLAGAPSPA